MPYNRNELLALPDEEKLALAEELWSSVEEKAMHITDEEVTFAEERLKLHNSNPQEGMEWSEVREKIKAKYGF